jgi:16S rRNA pseudouridine516 synthase
MRLGEPLDYFLTRRGVGTWASVRLLIQGQQVLVNGSICKHYRRRLQPNDVVQVSGVTIHDGEDTGTLICYKMAGYACSHEIKHAPLLYDVIPSSYQHPNLQTVGRLDRDTTGLLLLTIDGEWAQLVMSPKRRCWKRYRLAFSGELIQDAQARVSAGLTLLDDPRPCLPARLELLGYTADGLREANMHLCEGRYHQVKRMMMTLGGRVQRLHRDRIGGLTLPDDLTPGDMRPLRVEESRALFDQSENELDIPPKKQR